MDFQEDFYIPPVEQKPTVMSEEEASDQAFYTAATSSPNPIEDYATVYSELSQRGKSQMYDNAVKRWEEEQDVGLKQVVSKIITDQNMPMEQKQDVLRQYAVGGYVSKDLRDKYIETVASTTVDKNISEEKTQRAIVKNLPATLRDIKVKEDQFNVFKGYAGLEEWNKQFGAILKTGANVLNAIPAGIAGLWETVRKRDVLTGQELAGQIMTDFAQMPANEAEAKYMAILSDKLALLGVPSRKIAEESLRETGSPRASVVAGVVLDPLNLPIGGIALKTLKFGGKLLKVRPGSPIDIMAKLQPKLAENVAVGALQDATEETAKAAGTTKAEIVSEFVLPKALPDTIAEKYPSLHKALQALDIDLEQFFKSNKFDPNVQNVTERRKDLDTVYTLLNETRTPKYMQSQSYINSLDDVFEGRAVFGKTEGAFYTDSIEALKAAEDIVESYQKSINPGLFKELKIKDEVSGKEFTIEEFKKQPAIQGEGQFSVRLNWEKQYDELALHLFGQDAIKTHFLGFNVSNLARSSLGRWLFPTGRFPEWVEGGALTGAERTGAQARKFIDIIKNKVVNTKNTKELSALINEADSQGIEFFSPWQIKKRFPNLSSKQVDEVFEAHTYWRRVGHYLHAVENHNHLITLNRDGFKFGVYDETRNFDSKLGPVKADFKFETVDEIPAEVWDIETGAPKSFNWDVSDKTRILDQSGKQLVQVRRPFPDADGKIYNYALVGGKTSLDKLPAQILPRVPGWSPIKTKGTMFVRITPKQAVINGKTITNQDVLRNYSQFVGAAKDGLEAAKLKEHFEKQREYKDYTVDFVPDRDVQYGRVIEEMSAHGNLLHNAMKRGDRLRSLEGPAPIEDRLVTMINTVRSIAKQNAMRPWENGFIDAFVASYKPFLKDGEFPAVRTDIVPKGRMNKQEAKEFNNAVRLYEYYAKIKSFESLGDQVWERSLMHIADVLESWKIPASTARELAKKGNMLVSVPTQIASTMFIHLNPIKQWIIQPAQLLEMYAIFPKTALQRLVDLGGIRIALASEAPILKGKGGLFYDTAKKMVPGMSKKEFDDTIKAIKESGILESVDYNVLVHGMYKDVSRGFEETSWQAAMNNTKAAVGFIPKVSRSVGFDFAEINNRLGLWLIVKDIWKERNPGKNWNTPENIAYISRESLKLSGAMNRAGSLPYQSGAMSVLFQFAAISHKLTMNMLQDNATMLTGAQRARLAATRALLWGTKYGVLGGAAAYYFIDRSDNPVVQEQAEVFKRGLADRAFNKLMEAITGTPGDIAISPGLSPYGQYGAGLPYVDVYFEMLKMFDDKPAGPRFPAFGAAGTVMDAIGRMQSWSITKDVTHESFGKMVWEAAKVASSMNNWAKGQLMLSTKEKMTKLGNNLGLEFTASEAYAQMLGFTTYKEQALWDSATFMTEYKDRNKQMATQIHQWMINQLKETGKEDFETKIDLLLSFTSMLKDDKNWTDQDIRDVTQQVFEMDKQSFKDVKTSVFMTLLKARSDKNAEELKAAENKLRPMLDENSKELLDVLDGKKDL